MSTLPSLRCPACGDQAVPALVDDSVAERTLDGVTRPQLARCRCGTLFELPTAQSDDDAARAPGRIVEALGMGDCAAILKISAVTVEKILARQGGPHSWAFADGARYVLRSDVEIWKRRRDQERASLGAMIRESQLYEKQDAAAEP
ncbi:MAG: hypothetical protein ABI831_24935 [Betaproteobacteria bacterium]